MSWLDVEGWESVLKGEEKLTWELWASPIDHSAVLNEKGKQVLNTAISGLRAFLGDDFLDTGRGKEHPLFSLVHMPGNDVPVVYRSLLDLYVHIELLKKIVGFSKVRKSLRRNQTSAGWGHELLQLEVAGLAARSGRDLEYEPKLQSGRSADLQVALDDELIVFELVQLGTSQFFNNAQQYNEEMNDFLLKVSMRHLVAFSGVWIRVATPEERSALMLQISSAVKTLVQMDKNHMIKNDLVRLSITKTNSFKYPVVSGPPTQDDEWARLEARIHEKSKQTLGATNVWIRLDGLSGLWYFTPWATQGLKEKLNSIAPLCKNVLQKYSHVNGIVISNRWSWQVGQPEETVCVSGNFALRRHFSDGRERETMVVRRDKSARSVLEEIVEWYENEPSWLDWGLEQLGYSCFASLIHES